jgi:hypothetical protein
MKRYAKSTAMVSAGILWFLFALGFVFLLFQYLSEGTGIQSFGFFGVSSFTVLFALVQFVGFTAAACLSFVIGVGLCSHGFVPAPDIEKKPDAHSKRRFAFSCRWVLSSLRHKDTDETLRCVRCEVGLAARVHICPECGWTQPYGRDT